MRRVLKWIGVAVGVLAVLFATFVALVLVGVIGPPKVSPEAIASSVDRDPERLGHALGLPAASMFERELYWQRNGSLCGPASLVNVYRARGQEVADEEAVLDGSGKCPFGICVMGLTLDELAHVARTNGQYRVTVLRDLSPEQFKEHLRRSNDPSNNYIVNFTREKIFGAGGGHHSPIGGYLEDEDLVLVLDVNEEFGPWLVERDRLFAAMDTMDGDRERGLLLIE